jgi:hypothetical protein
MATSRYQKDQIIGTPQRLASSQAILRIRQAIANGSIATREITVTEAQRLDHIAGDLYGDGKLWWIIAIASGIGWWLQVPPGTRLLAPVSANAVLELV